MPEFKQSTSDVLKNIKRELNKDPISEKNIIAQIASLYSSNTETRKAEIQRNDLIEELINSLSNKNGLDALDIITLNSIIDPNDPFLSDFNINDGLKQFTSALSTAYDYHIIQRDINKISHNNPALNDSISKRLDQLSQNSMISNELLQGLNQKVNNKVELAGSRRLIDRIKSFTSMEELKDSYKDYQENIRPNLAREHTKKIDEAYNNKLHQLSDKHIEKRKSRWPSKQNSANSEEVQRKMNEAREQQMKEKTKSQFQRKLPGIGRSQG